MSSMNKWIQECEAALCACLGAGSFPQLLAALAPCEGSAGQCTALWSAGALAYRCRTCQLTPSAAICVACFRAGGHDSHDWVQYRSQSGGCCDCGDTTAWRARGCCPAHKPGRRAPAGLETLLPPQPQRAVVRGVVAAAAARLTECLETLCAGNKQPPSRQRLEAEAEEAVELMAWLLRLAGAAPPLRRLLCDLLCAPLPPPPPPPRLQQQQPQQQQPPPQQQQQPQQQQPPPPPQQQQQPGSEQRDEHMKDVAGAGEAVAAAAAAAAVVGGSGGGPGLGVGPGRPAGGYVPPALLAGCYEQEAAEALGRLTRRGPPPPLQPGALPAQDTQLRRWVLALRWLPAEPLQQLTSLLLLLLYEPAFKEATALHLMESYTPIMSTIAGLAPPPAATAATATAGGGGAAAAAGGGGGGGVAVDALGEGGAGGGGGGGGQGGGGQGGWTGGRGGKHPLCSVLDRLVVQVFNCEHVTARLVREHGVLHAHLDALAYLTAAFVDELAALTSAAAASAAAGGAD
ncbi:hypothetical protein HYH02_015036, partial [Chlamydomonas schloesseri]